MENKTFLYKAKLKEFEEKRYEERRKFLDSQNKLAEEVAKKVNFGEIEIIKNDRFGNIALKKVSFKDLEDSYFIEQVKDDAYMEFWGMNRKIYEKTYVLTSKNDKEESLPICIYIRSYIKCLNLNEEKVEVRCSQLLSDYSTEVYGYCVESFDFKFDCRYSNRKPIIKINKQFSCNEREKEIKEIIKSYVKSISNTDFSDFSLLLNESIDEIEDTSSVVEISKKLNEEQKTLMDCINNQIYKKIWDEFSLYLQLNTFNPYTVEYDLFETINMKIEISRKSYNSDITVTSRKYGLDIILTNRDLDIIFVNVDLKSTVVEENLKYSFKRFKDKNNIKNVVLQFLE